MKKCLNTEYVQNIAPPAMKMARALSLMVHLASAAGDPRTLALAVASLFSLTMADGMSMRLATA